MERALLLGFGLLVALILAAGFVPRFRDARVTMHAVLLRAGLAVGLDRENVECLLHALRDQGEHLARLGSFRKEAPVSLSEPAYTLELLVAPCSYAVMQSSIAIVSLPVASSHESVLKSSEFGGSRRGADRTSCSRR